MDEKQLEEIAEKFCDKYCKYPYLINEQSKLDDICENCPMNQLFDLL